MASQAVSFSRPAETDETVRQQSRDPSHCHMSTLQPSALSPNNFLMVHFKNIFNSLDVLTATKHLDNVAAVSSC